MRRLSQDRGAVAAIIVILMVPMLTMTALVVDLGMAYTQRRVLQNASDASALAIAANCALAQCGNINKTADDYAAANVRTKSVKAKPKMVGDVVTVETSDTVDYSFAPVVGIKKQTIAATSSATWSNPSKALTKLSLTFSYCAWQEQTAGVWTAAQNLMPVERTIYLTGETKALGCSKSGTSVAGGFGWVQTPTGDCSITTEIGQVVASSPGRSPSSGCSTADFAAYQNKTVLIPIFDATSGSGSNATYRVFGYAAFTITGYKFTGQYEWNRPCTGNDTCIRGFFSGFVDRSDVLTYSSSSPDLGARVIHLI